MTWHRCMALLFVGCVTLLGGCQETPRAPALANETVYQNDTIGLVFVTPEGWSLYAKTSLPPGALNRPIRLTAYTRSVDKFHAEFELYAVDVPPSQDVLEYLGTHKIGPDTWTPKGKPTPETINGVPATRSILAGVKVSTKMRREIIAFPRGDRQFLIVFTHHDADTQSRDQAQKAIESIKWK